MKCEVYRINNSLWVRYWIDKSDKWFIIELTEQKIQEIEAVKHNALYQVHEILNQELYKQTWISLWKINN